MTTFLYSYRMPAGNQPGRPGPQRPGVPSSRASAPAWWTPATPSSIPPRSGTASTGGARLSGFSLVTADDLEAAVAMASQCPALDQGGGVEVGVITEFFRDKRLIAQD